MHISNVDVWSLMTKPVGLYAGPSLKFCLPVFTNFSSCSVSFITFVVCVFIFFHHEGFFRLQDVRDILERYGSTILCCEYLSGCFYQVHSSPYLKMSYFTSKDENSSHHKLERKRWYIDGQRKDDIYWYRIYVRPEPKPTSDEKILKIRRLL